MPLSAPSASSTQTPHYNRRIASVGISGKAAVTALTALPMATATTPVATDCSTTGVTYDIRVAAPAQFDAVRILIANAASTPVTGLKCAFSHTTVSGGWHVSTTLPSPSGTPYPGAATGSNPGSGNIKPQSIFPNNTPVAAQFLKFTFGGYTKAEIDLPAALIPYGVNASNGIHSWTASDWMPCNSLLAPRSDGGSLPLIDVRLQFPMVSTASGFVSPISGATPSAPGVTLMIGGFGNWGIDSAIDGNGRTFNQGHMWRVLAAGGSTNGGATYGVDGSINFQGSNSPITLASGPLIIVQFHTLTDVHTILYANDSIGEYNNASYTGATAGEYANSYAFRAALAAASATGKQISWCPITWPSGTSMSYQGNIAQIINYIQPEILWVKPIGPNEGATSGGLTATHSSYAAADLGFALNMGQQYQSKIVIEPYLAQGSPTVGAQFSTVSGSNVITMTQAATSGPALALGMQIIMAGIPYTSGNWSTTYIQSLASGTLGAVGSTYNLSSVSGSIVAVNATTTATGVPATIALVSFGATDSLRLAWNASFAAQAATMGFTYLDTDTPWTLGGSTFNGQALVNAQMTSDGTHSSEYGHASLAASITQTITNIVAASV